MSDFKAKMHQIQFRLGLCPRPRWGSLSTPPDPLAAIGGSTSKGRGRGGRGGERVRRGGEGEEGKGAPPHFLLTTLTTVTHMSVHNVTVALGCQ